MGCIDFAGDLWCDRHIIIVGNNIIVMMFYESTIKLLDAYQANLGGTPPSNYDGDLLSEVRERLKMLSILYDKVCKFQSIAISITPNFFQPISEFFEYTPEKNINIKRMPTKEEFDNLRMFAKQQNEIVLEMKMYAESFYYFAARIRKIIKYKKEPLPFLKNFESKGIRDVRNRLIEHPQVLIPACGFGGEY